QIGISFCLSAQICVHLRPISLCLCVSVVSYSLKNKLHLREQIEQNLARIHDALVRGAKVAKIRRTICVRRRVDIPKTTTRFQSCRTEGHRDVVNQKWTIRDAKTIVPTDLVPNVRLK